MAGDLETEWAGVLQRWGSSVQAGGQGVIDSDRQSSNYSSKYDSQDRQSSNYSAKYDSQDRQSSNYSIERKSSNYNSKYDSLKSGTVERKPSVRQEDRKTEVRQTTRDREERENLSGGKKGGGRQRWSSVSPGKENLETSGYRSRSATRSPTTNTTSTTSRLYSSTVASRAKQITPVLTELSYNRKASGGSTRTSHSTTSRGATPSRQSPPSENYQPRRSSSSKSFSSMHRSSSSHRRSSSQRRSSSVGRSSVSPPASSTYKPEGRKSSGSVKISLSSLKKASVESWEGGQHRQGKKKSISSVYIG